MDLKTKLKNFLEKLRGLQDKQKKIILWTIVGILAIIMGIFWLKGTLYRLENMGEIDLNLPEFEIPEMENNFSEEITPSYLDWKTYTNSEYGFEIKIPEDWIIEEYADGTIGFTTQELQDAREKNILDCKQGKECSAEFLSETAYFNTIENGDNYTSDDIINGTSRVELENNFWTKYEPTGFWDNIHYRIVNDDNNIGYDFRIDDKKYEDTLRQILSTFKFIK